MTKRGAPIREGKAKILYETEPAGDHVIQYFKDDATAFNALKKGQIKEKGVINNAVSSWIFSTSILESRSSFDSCGELAGKGSAPLLHSTALFFGGTVTH